MKATSFDIAYRAGVSQSTVSRALRNSPLVNEETRRKIQAIAKELNYKVDKNARNLRSQQSNTLALLLFEDTDVDESQINPFFLSMLGSITRACSNAGYDLLVSFQEMDNDWHAEYADSNKADGIILLGYGDYTDYREKLVQLHQQGTHFVRFGAEVSDMPVTSIGGDNVSGGKQLTEHLISQGCKTMAFIGTISAAAPEFLGRYQGHKEALEAAALTIDSNLQINAISTEQAGYQATKELLKRGVAFDGLFGASDLIAIGAMRALQEAGLQVPGDVAVVGYDDIPMARVSKPALTTVKQDTLLAGQLLVDNLLAMIAGSKPKTILMPVQLISRESSVK
ncbi:LacI family DNA-binding transcriptional regulator [Thalassotalea mangrovi]|uniref:LacI family transcriptional regulator n=1 Tax=Thalassotalea mangrovi TaxID=2572245 RepID=A0A4U1B7P5_9GAMM|nr:LacI family DNA-binding transcriptional regulator [Thalassotalea mangrovi]TKB46262.1 LacI family transcriptional regulator [Thalassotalea mangrovi]